MGTVLTSKKSGGDFTPHPAGAFMAVCCDVYTIEKPNKYYGTTKNNGKVDNEETKLKVCIAFLTTEPIEIDGDIKPRYVSFWGTASMGTTDYPSNVRKFLKGWFPTLTDKQCDEGFDIDRLIGKPAWLTITHSTDQQGKTWANIAGAMQPPPGTSAPVIPADFVRHDDKKDAAEIAKGTPTGDNMDEPF